MDIQRMTEENVMVIHQNILEVSHISKHIPVESATVLEVDSFNTRSYQVQ